MTASGDRSLLPYFEKKSLAPETDGLIRSRAASAYLRIADLDEAVGFLMRYCADPSIQQGKWLLVQQYLDKYEMQEKLSIPPEVATPVNSALLTILQTTDVRDVANRINQHLLRRVPQYTNSVQRASLVRFATVGNVWVTNTFHPIKAHFDKIPQEQRTDLRGRFPDLPQLPEEPEESGARPAWPVWAGIAVVGSVAILVAVRLGRGLL
jgi:hypothetical protein